MFRELVVCALILALPLVCHADKETEPTETVIRLTVQPAPAPKPALRYQLFPELREMNPGNPAQEYLMCFMEQNNFWFSKEAVDNREKWQTMPLKDLPLTELRKFGYGKGVGPLRRADYAARLDKVDWQLLLKIKNEGEKLLLPELQPLRTLGSALKIRFRMEVVERRFDDALVTAKTLFALSQQLGDQPTLISALVGMSVANLAIGPLEEMLQQPGCPNLFWALTDLPKPLVDYRKGMQSERLFLNNVFEVFDHDTPMTESQLKVAVDRIRELIKDLNGLPWLKEDVAVWLAAQAKDEARVRAGRRRLVEFGLSEDKVKKFPALQVIILEDKLSYEIYRDEGMKLMSLPYWQAEPLLINRKSPRGDEEKVLFMGLSGGIRKVRQAQVRLEQRLALLCCIEALRLHAAEHDGKLPAQLDDVKLPLPVDPVTGKPFSYKLEGETAKLRGTPPSGMETNPQYNIRFEVVIRK